ncbi:MAG: rhodanese-like domain-containing protein [Bacteroidia bacterium]|nr:rhodanese-like domain-containing protein [Bacteroidia bacterium]
MKVPSSLKSVALLLTVIAVVSYASACAQQGGIPSSTVTQMRDAIAKKGPGKVIVLDVRTAPELTSELGKLDGIVHIPLSELSSRVNELAKYKSSEIHVICRSGNRSVAATQILRQKGYTAFNVQGGMLSWRSTFGSVNK